MFRVKEYSVGVVAGSYFASRIKRLGQNVGMVALLAVLVGCGNEWVPTDANLTISPNTHSTNIVEHQDADGYCLFNPDYYMDIPILIQLSSANGSAIGDATLNVYVDLAANSYSGIPMLGLYDDLNDNGVIDDDSELISGEDDSIARVRTDQWTGARMLLLRINLSCSYKGDIVVFTGGVSSSAEIEVVADEVYRPDNKTEEGK